MYGQISLENISLITYVIVFGSGVLISFTPCVYPLIPVIIAYIGGTQLKSRREGFIRSLSYVCGLALVYAALGAVAALSGGLFGVLQNNVWINLAVANIFILMGLFMLDVFTLPQIRFFKQGVDGQGAGAWGAFLTGAVSGFVVGPCTTPVLGGILAYVAAKRNIVAGTSLLAVYAFGMGLPLVVIGSSVTLLKKMPRSGAWMLKIKKVFGFLLIACGEYFLLGMR